MIYEILNTGKENAIPTQELSKVLNLDVRSMRKQIEKERLEGCLILSNRSSGGGYYKPSNELEIKEFIGTLERDAFSTLKIARKAKEALRKGENAELRTNF